jgi:formate hydrogenlyase transcriptional activator
MSASNPVSALIQPLGEMPPEAVVFGSTEAMRALRERLEKIAGANVPVLIHGESGTGKDIIARMIHAGSPWKTGPWVKVNCPAIPGTLLESELFGYEKGAFTGAYGAKPGRVEMAHRGTLFLDEISELDMALQSKLLQLLQDGQFCRIGAQEDKKVEVRVVCATNRKLEEEIINGSFRADLFYRINVVNVYVPALRERSSDIPQLVEYFLEYYNRKFNARAAAPSAELMKALKKYHWPGNIRELENLIERAVIVSPGPVLRVPLSELKSPSEPVGESLTLRAAERDHILRALEATNWVLAGPRGAAARLGMKRTTLQSKMRKLGVAKGRHS